MERVTALFVLLLFGIGVSGFTAVVTEMCYRLSKT